MAAHVLLVYETSEGHTARIAERIAAILRAGNLDVTVTRLNEAPDRLDQFDGIVIGGPIHFSKYDDGLLKYAKDHATDLAAKPNGFFTVCMRAAEPDGAQGPEVLGYVDSFREQTGWSPDITAVFGGALAYTRYGIIKRFVMKRIAAQGGFSTNTKSDHDYTDWNAVEHFAVDFFQHVGAGAVVESPVG